VQFSSEHYFSPSVSLGTGVHKIKSPSRQLHLIKTGRSVLIKRLQLSLNKVPNPPPKQYLIGTLSRLRRNLVPSAAGQTRLTPHPVFSPARCPLLQAIYCTFYYCGKWCTCVTSCKPAWTGGPTDAVSQPTPYITSCSMCCTAVEPVVNLCNYLCVIRYHPKLY
jgi:hypothetical protein